MSLRLRVFLEPQQGATYPQLLAMAQLAEELGFDGFFRSDHYLRMGAADGRPGPSDAWVTLAGLARETHRLRLGTLLTAATFRLPGPLAVAVAGVDQMSGGRIELGLGAGWYAEEHQAFGIPFPSTAERFDRLEEQLAILTGLWGSAEGQPFTFAGRYHRLGPVVVQARPHQRPHPPVIVGGTGRQRTPALAARYANEFNVPFRSPDESRAAYARAAAACEAIGRDPGQLRRSAAVHVCCGADEAEFRRRAAAVHREVAEVRASGAGGSPGEVAERLAAHVRAGAQTLYLQLLDPGDLDHLRLIADAVVPRLAGVGP